MFKYVERSSTCVIQERQYHGDSLNFCLWPHTVVFLKWLGAPCNLSSRGEPWNGAGMDSTLRHAVQDSQTGFA